VKQSFDYYQLHLSARKSQGMTDEKSIKAIMETLTNSRNKHNIQTHDHELYASRPTTGTTTSTIKRKNTKRK
jgi:hypothetical protein